MLKVAALERLCLHSVSRPIGRSRHRAQLFARGVGPFAWWGTFLLETSGLVCAGRGPCKSNHPLSHVTSNFWFPTRLAIVRRRPVTIARLLQPPQQPQHHRSLRLSRQPHTYLQANSVAHHGRPQASPSPARQVPQGQGRQAAEQEPLHPDDVVSSG